jgi:L-threonylcarbamoyladenylate synthase
LPRDDLKTSHVVTLAHVAEELARAFWPGPLTLVLPVGDGTYTGFRVPDHPVPLALLRRIGHPLAVTSANRSGDPDAFHAQDAVKMIGSSVDMVLDGGPVTGMVPSTVIRVEDDRIEILRQGALDRKTIMQVTD